MAQVPARRSTHIKAKDVEVVNMDEILKAIGHTPKRTKDYFVLKIFGEDFRVLKQVNFLAMLLMDPDDPDATAQSIRSIIDMIHDEDQPRFRTAIARNAALDQEAINELVSRMVRGAAAPNPSSSPRGSGRTRSRTTSKALSAAS